MSSYHYLDEEGNPRGPVSEAEVEALAAAAEQKGGKLLVAKPGDAQWQPYAKNAAAPQPQPHAQPPQPQPAPRPAQPAAQPQPAARPQPLSGMTPPRPVAPAAVAPFGAPPPYGMPPMAGMPPPAGFAPYGAPPHAAGGHRAPWVSIVCYVLAVLSLVGVLVSLVLLIVSLAGGSKEGALASVGLLAGLAPGSFLLAFSFYWAGKLFSKADEILFFLRR